MKRGPHQRRAPPLISYVYITTTRDQLLYGHDVAFLYGMKEFLSERKLFFSIHGNS